MYWQHYFTFLSIAVAPFGVAHAADRTVCFEINVLDGRDQCPDSTVTGASSNDRRPCDPDTNDYSEIKGFLYTLWDKDSTAGDDDYIGTIYMNGTGLRCATFPWEGESYQVGDGETHPDVYVKLLYKIRGETSAITVTGVDGYGTQYPSISWRDGTLTADEFVAVNCQNGSNCYIDGGSPLLPALSAGSHEAVALAALDTAQRTMEFFAGGVNGTSNINYYIDGKFSLPCSCSGQADSQTMLQLSVARADEGDTVAHELGHVLHMREFGQDGLRSSVSGAWTLNSIETNSGATTEGWAVYVALVSWYDPESSNVVPRYTGIDLEDADVISPRTCAEAPNVAAQVAKSFWDMDDIDNENSTDGSGNDENDLSSNFLLNQWDDFPDGNQNNREDLEPNTDGDAVNLWDYRFNAPIADEQTFLEHNCMEGQVTD